MLPEPEPVPALTSAMEDYLEAIYHLEQEHRIARVRDIAKRLDVKMSSVSSALKILGTRGLIQYDPHQYITLTERGIVKAREIVRKHEVLKRFLVRVLKVEETAAEDNACRIEHHLDPEVIEKLIRFVGFMEICPVDQSRWMGRLADTCDTCLSCLDQARKKIETRDLAQKAALQDGMTLAEAEPGAQLIIDGIKGPAKSRKALLDAGLDTGAIVEIEGRDTGTGNIRVNLKGYHVSIAERDASKILVKPM